MEVHVGEIMDEMLQQIPRLLVVLADDLNNPLIVRRDGITGIINP
jgi:hypothetical protein